MTRHIPNLLTSCNLLCGCIGIYYIAEVNFYVAALMIFVAAVFDFLDGFSARWLNAYSPVGKSLDSLADLVSFGILPGLLVVKLQLILAGTDSITDLRGGFNAAHHIRMFSPLLIPLFSALRLAKFDNDPSQSTVFRGLPTPANAIFIAALVWSASKGMHGSTILQNNNFIFLITTVMAMLLISPFQFMSLKFKSYHLQDNIKRYLFLLLSLVFVIVWKIPGIILTAGWYVLLSLVWKND